MFPFLSFLSQVDKAITKLLGHLREDFPTIATQVQWGCHSKQFTEFI